jgi:hypothetical protein
MREPSFFSLSNCPLHGRVLCYRVVARCKRRGMVHCGHLWTVISTNEPATNRELFVMYEKPEARFPKRCEGHGSKS